MFIKELNILLLFKEVLIFIVNGISISEQSLSHILCQVIAYFEYLL